MRIQSLALRMPHDSLMAKAQLRKCLLEVRELNKVLMQKAKFIISIVNKRQKEDDKLIEVDCLKKKSKTSCAQLGSQHKQKQRQKCPACILCTRNPAVPEARHPWAF